MTDDRRPKRRLIPVDIINYYSKINDAGDLLDLEKTGYLGDLVYSGFMLSDSQELAAMFYGNKYNFDAVKVIREYRFKKSQYIIPESIKFKQWDKIRERIKETMKINELSIMIYPFSPGFERMRHEIEKQIIKVVELDDMGISVFPDFIFDNKSFLNSSHEVKASGGIYIGWLVDKIRQGKFNHDYQSYAELWQDYLYNPVAPKTILDTNTHDGLPIPSQTASAKNIQGKHFELFTQAISVFKDRYPDQWVTDASVWANLPELCPALVKRIEGDGENAEAIMKHGKPWKWRAFKSAFQRHQKTHGDT